MRKFIAVCLVPADKDKLILDNIIKSLAEKFDAYPFIPHITIYAGIFMEENKAKMLNDQALKELLLKPFTVNVKKLDHSEIFSKTLYVDFQTNSPMKKIYHYLRKKFLKYTDFNLHPHLSLIYKNNMPVGEKTKLINRLNIPNRILFDRIDVITSPRDIMKEEDVLSWKIIYSKKFH